MKEIRKQIILIYGLPCSGKSSLGKMLSAQLNTALLSSEKIWALLFNKPKTKDDIDMSKDENKIVYDSIALLADLIIKSNQSIVIEGVFRSCSSRAKIEEIATENNIPIKVIHLHADENVALERLHQRKKKECVEPAGPNTYQKIKLHFEEPADNHISIDTTELNDYKLYMKVSKYFE